MKNKPYRVHHKRPPQKTGDYQSIDETLQKLKKTAPPQSEYRDRSLKIHGLICAKCGREFDEKTRHLLTVHHKDGNHLNNPPDGSNWENLCVYCHDDEHTRELLGKYLSEGKEWIDHNGFVTLKQWKCRSYLPSPLMGEGAGGGEYLVVTTSSINRLAVSQEVAH